MSKQISIQIYATTTIIQTIEFLEGFENFTFEDFVTGKLLTTISTNGDVIRLPDMVTVGKVVYQEVGDDCNYVFEQEISREIQ